MLKKYRFWLVVVAAGLGLWWGVNQKNMPEADLPDNPKTTQIEARIGQVPLMVEVRKTEAEQALGLSWRRTMGENEGMVFVYDRPQQVMYWMKGMQFPLDFIWVREGRVVEVTERVMNPKSETDQIMTVNPAQQVDAVIEVNAGWVERNGIKVGDEVKILNPKL